MSAVPPAGAGDPLPTTEEIENWPTSHLSDAAETWRKAAGKSTDAFEQHRRNIVSPGGTEWEGLAKDAALSRVDGDIRVAGYHGEVLTEAASAAEDGLTAVKSAKREAVAAIQAARDDGFTVGSDRSVTDARRFDFDTVLERNKAAKEHAENIRWTAEKLVEADAFVGKRLQDKAAELHGMRFEGEGDGNGAHVQLVDNKFKQDPPPTDPPPVPKERHATDPNRSADGTYGPGNFGDGKAAEKAALDEIERRTHVPVIRQQVRATQPGVINPKTGKLQERYYDGLQPTGNPDEYIGYEAKTNPGSLDKDQQTFDKTVTRDHPATATLNGRPITIVDARTVYPPEGWVPPSAAAGAEHGAGPAAPAPPATTGYPGMPEPPKMWRDDGAPLAHPGDRPPVHAGSNPFPNWGTYISPEELAKSSDPELSNLGKFMIAVEGHDPNDPNNHA